MTWDAIWKALIPSVRDAAVALVTLILSLGGPKAYKFATKEKTAVAAPVAQQIAPVRTPQSDQTKLQLVGIQNTLDQIAEVAREMNSKECVVRPQRAAAKAK